MLKMGTSVLTFAFCFVMLTLALTPDRNNHGESVNDKDRLRDPTINIYSSILNTGMSIQNSDAADGNLSSNPQRAVIIMFDRAYDTQFTNAKPILDKYGFKVSFFVICSFVEGSGYHKLSN